MRISSCHVRIMQVGVTGSYKQRETLTQIMVSEKKKSIANERKNK